MTEASRSKLQKTLGREKSKESRKLFLFLLIKNKFINFIRKNIFYITAKSPFHLYQQSVNLSPADKKDVIENKSSFCYIFFISFFSVNEIKKIKIKSQFHFWEGIRAWQKWFFFFLMILYLNWYPFSFNCQE